MALTFLTLAVGGWVYGRHPVEQAMLVAAVALPVPTALLVAILAIHRFKARPRSEHRSSSVLMLVRLAAHLRSGSTLRAAIADMASSEPDLAEAARLAAAGRPMTQVVDAMRPGLGRFADLTGASIRMASASGGPLAPVVEQLVVQAMALDDLQRERRAAMAPGLLQAAIVGGAPVVVLGSMVVSGRFLDLVAAGPIQAIAALLGALLVIVGVAFVVRVARGGRA